jgi:hypothetical protein
MILNNFLKKVAVLANLATIAIAILLGIAVVQLHSLAKATRYAGPTRAAAPQPRTTAPLLSESLRVGAKLPIPGIEWAKNERTLLIALSEGCRYCAASGPFYQRLTKEVSGKKNIGVVAVFPQAVNQARNYLNSLGVSVADVRQMTLEDLGVIGTPTLILVNKEGVVTNSWRGQLPSNKEGEVLKQLKCGTDRQCS